MKKELAVALRAFFALSAWAGSWFALYKYEHISNFNEIDNIIGMLPVALAITFAIGLTLILCMKHIKLHLPIAIATTVLVILSVALFPQALRGNWWINATTSDGSEAALDLSVFAPFAMDSKTVKLGEKSELILTADLPVLDGATALYPVYAAFAEAMYDESAFSQVDVLCTNTRNAYEAIISGERDVVFVAGISAKQMAVANAAGADLRFTPIGREAFVFLVGKGNPIDNITYQQIRNVYSGKTAHWGTLGWQNGGRIIAFQRPEGSGSQTGLQMIMDGLPIQVPQPLPDASLIGSKSLIRQVSVEWRGVQPALGYSYRYFATTMHANPDSKILSVNGTYPSIENMQNGSYPFVSDFYAVTNGEPEGNTKLLVDWILSRQGQEIIEKTGYAPIIANKQ
jgi:phosphate transport system substrate-binding protein